MKNGIKGIVGVEGIEGIKGVEGIEGRNRKVERSEGQRVEGEKMRNGEGG